jgi:hypothetical protein
MEEKKEGFKREGRVLSEVENRDIVEGTDDESVIRDAIASLRKKGLGRIVLFIEAEEVRSDYNKRGIL